METNLSIDYGQSCETAPDYDGYPAVVVRASKGWADGADQWITASGHGIDLENGVRDLAAALLKMADEMAAGRRSDAVAARGSCQIARSS